MKALLVIHGGKCRMNSFLYEFKYVSALKIILIIIEMADSETPTFESLHKEFVVLLLDQG